MRPQSSLTHLRQSVWLFELAPALERRIVVVVVAALVAVVGTNRTAAEILVAYSPDLKVLAIDPQSPEASPAIGRSRRHGAKYYSFHYVDKSTS